MSKSLALAMTRLSLSKMYALVNELQCVLSHTAFESQQVAAFALRPSFQRRHDFAAFSGQNLLSFWIRTLACVERSNYFSHSTLKISSILEQHGNSAIALILVHRSSFLANNMHGLQRHWFLQVRIPWVELPLSWSTALLRETTCITHEVFCLVFVLENQALLLITGTTTPVND